VGTVKDVTLQAEHIKGILNHTLCAFRGQTSFQYSRPSQASHAKGKMGLKIRNSQPI